MQARVELDLPGGKLPTELFSLATYKAETGVSPRERRALGYLHKVKADVWRGRLREQERHEYEQQLPVLARAFAEVLPHQEYAALVAAPTSRPDLVCPFAQAVRQRFPDVPDLTPFIRRDVGKRSGEGAAFDELLALTVFQAPPSTPLGKGAILIVDDVFATGTTAAVIAHLLRARFGDLSIVVACPLRALKEPPSFKVASIAELLKPPEEAPKPSAAPAIATDDGPQPIVTLSDVDKIAEEAVRRQSAAIEYLIQHALNPPWFTERDVRAQNSLGNHLVGEASERAASVWLTKQGVAHRRAPTVIEELRDGVPDIATEPRGVRIDVKGSVFTGIGRFPHRQVKEDPMLAVLWCLPLRPDGYDYRRDYDVQVPPRIKILGWSTIAEVSAAENVNGCHEVPHWDMQPLSSLLEWIETGACPTAPPEATPAAT